ncbi:DUF6126 family protein [Streptomyces sp. 4F14]
MSDNREEGLPRALWIRLLVYVVGGHVLALFIWFLFEAGSRQ